MLKIIHKLWSAVFDLLNIAEGEGRKTVDQVREELYEIMHLCAPYAEAGDEDVCERKEMGKYVCINGCPCCMCGRVKEGTRNQRKNESGTA